MNIISATIMIRTNKSMNDSTHKSEYANFDELSFSDLAALIKDAWLPAIFGGLLFGLAALGISFLVEPKYRVQILVEYTGDPTKQERVRSGAGSLGGLAAIAGISLDSDGNPKNAALATLRSWDFAREFIRSNDLAPALNEKDWDDSKKSWRDPDNPPEEWSMIKRFRRDVLYVADDAKTGLILISIEWKDPKIAAEWATTLVSLINSRLKQITVEQTTRSIDRLNEEFAKTQNAELQRAIAGLLQAQIEALMFADIRDEFAFRTIDPAQAPPLHEYVFPSHIVFFLLGAVAGGFAGVVYRIFRIQRSRTRLNASA